MKCSAILATLLITATARAATLSLQWQSQPGVDKISLAPSDTAEIEVILELGSNGDDSISGLFFSLEAGPVEHIANFTSLPGWSALNDESDSVGLPFGPSQFAAGSGSPGGPDDLRGIGFVMVGSFLIRYDDISSPPGTEFEVAFDGNANNQIVASDGRFYNFILNTGSSFGYAAYSGYWTFGKGSPGVTSMQNSIPRDPLIITKAIPEPANLALLGLAGLALVCRRVARQ